MKKIMLVCFLIIFPLCVVFSQSGIINTIAGNGVDGYSGDGGPALNSEFNAAISVKIDASGNIYITDQWANRIRMVNASGIISTIAGNGYDPGIGGYSGDGGPATNAELNHPSDVAIDAVGNVFISDVDNYRIREVNISGIISTYAGNGITGYRGDGGPATDAEMNIPIGLAFDKKGNLYITDQNNRVVRMVDNSGIIHTIAGNGVIGYTGDGGPATSAEFIITDGIAVDSNNNIYIDDNVKHVVRKVDSLGIISTFAGNGYQDSIGDGGFTGDGGPATTAELEGPGSVAVDLNGNIFINDGDRIRMVNQPGIISTVAGNGSVGFSGDGGPAILAEFKGEIGIDFDNSGNLYIADVENFRIREIIGFFTGINQIQKVSQLSLFPNPAQNTLYVQLQGNAKAEALQLYSITGQMVLEQKTVSAQYSILNTQYLQNGVYFLKVQLQDGSTIVKKVEIIK